jgi:hypothetical protein
MVCDGKLWDYSGDVDQRGQRDRRVYVRVSSPPSMLRRREMKWSTPQLRSREKMDDGHFEPEGWPDFTDFWNGHFICAGFFNINKYVW